MRHLRVGARTAEADRKRLQDQRRMLERVIDRADHLEKSDRALLRGVYDRGMTISDLARVAGHDPRRVQHRVRRLTMRLSSPAFVFVLRHGREWPADRRRVAESIILEGATQCRAAEKLGLSIHCVRLEIDRVRLLFEQQQKQHEQERTQPLAASR